MRGTDPLDGAESGIKLKNTAGGRGRALSAGHSFTERLHVPSGFNHQRGGQEKGLTRMREVKRLNPIEGVKKPKMGQFDLKASWDLSLG